MLGVFFDCRSFYAFEFIPRGSTVNQEFYLTVLGALRKAKETTGRMAATQLVSAPLVSCTRRSTARSLPHKTKRKVVIHPPCSPAGLSLFPIRKHLKRISILINRGNTRKHAGATNQYFFGILYGMLGNIVRTVVRKQGIIQDGIMFNKIYPLHIIVLFYSFLMFLRYLVFSLLIIIIIIIIFINYNWAVTRWQWSFHM
jgi:hypothetical protein